MIVNPKDVATVDLHQYILGAVSPRPIAFASTLGEDGVANLAPYSFFNCFSSNPPILVFSSNRRVEDNTTKDTLHNIERTKQVVINVVNYPIVRQMALCSVNFPKTVSEFEKSGLTPIPSTLVAPPRVKESPVAMECEVQDIIPLGDKGGAGHLIICHVLLMHIDDSVLNEKNRIMPDKIDLVGRMGRNWYVRASGAAVFELNQPVMPIAIGFDQLPAHVRHSSVLTGNELAQLGALHALPSADEIGAARTAYPVASADDAHNQAKRLLAEGKAAEALALLSGI